MHARSKIDNLGCLVAFVKLLPGFAGNVGQPTYGCWQLLYRAYDATA